MRLKSRTWLAAAGCLCVLLWPKLCLGEELIDQRMKMVEQAIAQMKRELTLEAVELEIEIARDALSDQKLPRSNKYYSLIQYSEDIRMRYNQEEECIKAVVEMKPWAKKHKDREYMMERIARVLQSLIENGCLTEGDAAESAKWRSNIIIEYYDKGLKEKLAQWNDGKLLLKSD